MRGRRRPRCWQWRGGEDGRREAVVYMQAGRHDAGGARPAGRAMGSVGSSAERRRPLPGPGLLCQPCGGHPLLVRKSSVSYPSVLCECPVRRAERGVRSGARVLPLRVSRVTPSGAARTARVEGGSGPGGRGGEHGRTRVARPAKDSQGIGRQGFVSLGGLSALLSARQTGRVR